MNLECYYRTPEFECDYHTPSEAMFKCHIIAYDDNKYVLIKDDTGIREVKLWYCHVADDPHSPTVKHEDVTGRVPFWCGGY